MKFRRCKFPHCWTALFDQFGDDWCIFACTCRIISKCDIGQVGDIGDRGTGYQKLPRWGHELREAQIVVESWRRHYNTIARMPLSATNHQHRRSSCLHSPHGRLRHIDRLRRPRWCYRQLSTNISPGPPNAGRSGNVGLMILVKGNGAHGLRGAPPSPMMLYYSRVHLGNVGSVCRSPRGIADAGPNYRRRMAGLTRRFASRPSGPCGRCVRTVR
jgi:hypothetical protein